MLLNLINDLLDLAKQERLTFELNKSYFNLIETITSTIQTMQFLADQK
jgi:signal transduction histidine kinase